MREEIGDATEEEDPEGRMQEEMGDATEEEDPEGKCRLAQNVRMLETNRGRHRQTTLNQELPLP